MLLHVDKIALEVIFSSNSFDFSYLYYEFNVAPHTIPEILNEWKLDRDVVKKTLFPLDSEKIHPIIFDQCTFEDEMKPAPYRYVLSLRCTIICWNTGILIR